MPIPETSRGAGRFRLALLVSLLLHGAILFLPRQEPPAANPPARHLQARLGRPSVRPAPPAPVVALPPAKPQAAPRPAAPRGEARRGSKPAREDARRFPDSPPSPLPTGQDLAQRALAAARDIGRRPAEREEAGSEILERLPDSPPVDPFSLEMYLDALVKKLNRSAAYVSKDPRARGVKKAAVQVRLAPDGSLAAFRVLYANDQQAEIDFIRGVVERAVPFSPFSADMRRSARSLALTICIEPGGDGGFGFTRRQGGGGC